MAGISFEDYFLNEISYKKKSKVFGSRRLDKC